MPIHDEAVRQRVLGEHAILRVLIERLRQAAVKARSDGCTQELRDAGRTLHLVLEAHARVEEDVLGPSLLASGGTRRLEELHEGHLRALAKLQRMQGRGYKRHAALAARLAPHLLAALDLEERELVGTARFGSSPTNGCARDGARVQAAQRT
jgi:hypothetical protein